MQKRILRFDEEKPPKRVYPNQESVRQKASDYRCFRHRLLVSMLQLLCLQQLTEHFGVCGSRIPENSS